MKVSELIRELGRYPKNAHVYINNDWDAINEDGNFTNLADVTDVVDDIATVDTGLDFEDEHRIIISI